MNAKSQGMRTFLIVWFGQLISIIGSELTSFGMGVLIYERTGSPTLFALNILVAYLPSVILSPFAGALVDRLDRRKLMILADSGAGLASLGIALLLWGDVLQVWHVYALTAISATFNTIQFPAFGAATSLLVPKEHLGRVGGMQQAGYSLSALVGPGLAGLLYVTIGPTGIFLIDFATFLFAVATLALVRFPQPERATGSDEGGKSFLQEVLFGWKYIVARPGLIGLLTLFAFLNFCASLTFPLLTPMLLERTTPDMVGYIGTGAGAGMLIGALVMSAWGGTERKALTILPCEMMAGVGLVVSGLTPAIPLIAAGQFLFLGMMPISNGASQAMWQRKVAPGLQGRVFAARRMVASSITPLAYLIAGPLSEKIFEPAMAVGGPLANSAIAALLGTGPGRGIGLMLVICGGLYVLANLVGLAYPRIRRLDLELPDAVEEVATSV